MVRIKLLAQVADDQKGAVIEVDERRARRLIQTGYASAVAVKKAEKAPVNTPSS